MKIEISEQLTLALLIALFLGFSIHACSEYNIRRSILETRSPGTGEK